MKPEEEIAEALRKSPMVFIGLATLADVDFLELMYKVMGLVRRGAKTDLYMQRKFKDKGFSLADIMAQRNNFRDLIDANASKK